MNALQQLAKSSIESAADDDVRAAKDIALARVLSDSDLQRAALEYAVGRLIDDEWRAGRAARWHGSGDSDTMPQQVAFGSGQPSAPSPTLLAGLRSVVSAERDRLMEYEMEPGKRLRDATRGDLLQSASRLEKQADTMKLRGAWLKAIAALLPNNTQPVREVLREADLQRLQKRVMRATEAA